MPKSPMYFWLNKPAISDKSFFIGRARSGTTTFTCNFTMNFIDYGTLFTFSFYLGISIGIFAGRFFERSEVLQELENFQLEKIKLKTEAELQFLCREHLRMNEELQLPVPDGTSMHISDFLGKAFLVDETVRERILGLTQIYMDLKNNGATE
uniref:Cytoplasmic male sterility-associated protein n=1 Tax=Capsicum annuum TaxID=4072 RepID=Q3YJR6_CAPAN|nr:cytoplasmic male sterility-associated protein [Capsicum annuum]